MVVTRSCLYARVWVTPVAHLAREYGLTSGRFVRMCQKNRVPLPPQGFWNRGVEDRAARQVPLPDADQNWEIELIPSDGHSPMTTQEDACGIQIPEKLTRPHQLVRMTRSNLQDAPRDEYGRHRPGPGCLYIRVTRKCRQRAYRIMDALIRECEARGWRVEIPERYGYSWAWEELGDCDGLTGRRERPA